MLASLIDPDVELPLFMAYLGFQDLLSAKRSIQVVLPLFPYTAIGQHNFLY